MYKDRIQNKNKAFLGTALAIGSLVASVGSSIANGIKANKQQNLAQEQARLQAEAQEKQNKAIERAANTKAGMQTAANLTNYYSNEAELANEFRNRFMRCGGKRKKAKLGAGDISAIGNIASSLINTGFNAANTASLTTMPVSPGQAVLQAQAYEFKPKEAATNNEVVYANRDTKPSVLGYKQAKCGGRKRAK